MLLVADLADAVVDLVAGRLECPTRDCGRWLAPWGHARARRVRVAVDRVETHRPRRGYCRSCRHSHVLSDLVTYPGRLDTVQVVTSALLAAAGGAGHRRVAELVDRPVTTVRDWLRRARRNAEAVRGDVMLGRHHLDPSAGAIRPAGSVLGDMLEAVGAATAAWIRRFGPPTHVSPFQIAVLITRAGILAKHPQPRWWGVV
jgi:hypothetical protein